jgi:hypothetical protein
MFAAIDGYPAFHTHAHAAKRAAGLTAGRAMETADAFSGNSGGDKGAWPHFDRLTVDPYLELLSHGWPLPR